MVFQSIDNIISSACNHALSAGESLITSDITGLLNHFCIRYTHIHANSQFNESINFFPSSEL
jgi:hypothetical protein